MTGYQWQVESWDPATSAWTLDGNESLATGIASRFDGTAEDLAERLLRNWTDEPNTAGGRWRATVWAYDPSRPPGEPAASAEITRRVTVTGQDSSPSAGPAPASPSAKSIETSARHTQLNVFDHGEYRSQRGGWTFIDDNGFLPAATLIGKTVNIGTKDGDVYDSATVTALEDGVLVLAGGVHGHPRTGRETEVVTEAQVGIYDIARGYVHDHGSVTASAPQLHRQQQPRPTAKRRPDQQAHLRTGGR